MHINNKGQAIVELAASIFVLAVLVFGIISVGCYIYDKCVYNHAADKALDRAIAISMSRSLSSKDINDVQNLAVTYANGSIFTSAPVATVEVDKSAKQIKVSIVSNYNCFIPYFEEIFNPNNNNTPQVSEQTTYIYAK